jgi:uncharacterized SAM-binding protein YcdF (DUF218 family)
MSLMMGARNSIGLATAAALWSALVSAAPPPDAANSANSPDSPIHEIAREYAYSLFQVVALVVDGTVGTYDLDVGANLLPWISATYKPLTTTLEVTLTGSGAIDLFEAGIAPTLIVTGGKAEGDRTTEAASARAYAIKRGVPAAAILVEDESRTTLESIRGVAGLMDDHDLGSAVFVSDPTHMLRVLRMAADAGVTGFGSPTTTSPVERDPVARVDAVVHELGALAVYLLDGPAR